MPLPVYQICIFLIREIHATATASAQSIAAAKDWTICFKVNFSSIPLALYIFLVLPQCVVIVVDVVSHKKMPRQNVNELWFAVESTRFIMAISNGPKAIKMCVWKTFVYVPWLLVYRIMCITMLLFFSLMRFYTSAAASRVLFVDPPQCLCFIIERIWLDLK